MAETTEFDINHAGRGLTAHGVLLSIDPGNNCGAAIHVSGRLDACGLVNLGHSPGGVEPLEWLRNGGFERFEYLAIEIPRVSKQTKNPASIVTLAISAGRMIERFPHEKLLCTFVDQWKGSVDKETYNARVLATMYDAERSLLHRLSQSTLHNVLDAIGIGFRATGRMLRGKGHP